jgi:hypothetical protein
MSTILKKYRFAAMGAITWGLLVMSPLLGAAQEVASPVHDGVVVEVANKTLVMTGEDGRQHSHEISADAKLTLDGKTCKLADLKSGTRIRVTTLDADNTTAVRIEAIDKHLAFASHIHDGKFVSMTGKQLVMTADTGNEQSLTVADDAKLTLDGKVCEVSELKKGTKIRVFTQNPFSVSATRIEAIDRNLAFASDRQEGKLVSGVGDKLVFTTLDGKQHNLSLPTTAMLTLDGKRCKLAELKPGTRIRVTTRDAYSNVTTGIEAIDRNSEFASEFHDGLVVKTTGNQLVMTDSRGNNEHTCTLSAKVKITLDGKTASLSQLKSGMRIRVTPQSKDANEAVRIEAIDKNRTFMTSL